MRLQVKGAAERELLSIFIRFICNDLHCIRDRFSAGIPEIHQVVAGTPVVAVSLLLIEVQGKQLVADLPGRGDQADGYRLRIVLLSVMPIVLTLAAKVAIVYDRHHHFL